MSQHSRTDTEDALPRLDDAAKIGLAITLIPVVVGVGKLLYFVHWDPANAVVTAKALNFATATFLVAIPVLSSFTLWVFIYAQARFLSAYGPGRTVAVVGALLLATAVLPLDMYVFFAGVTVWLYLVRRRGDAAPPRAYYSTGFRFVFLASIVWVASGSILLGGGFWPPAEVIRTQDGTARTAYVLESGDHDLTVIDLDGRRAEILRQEDVTGRVLCRPRAESFLARFQNRPLQQFLTWRENPTPLCADVPSK